MSLALSLSHCTSLSLFHCLCPSAPLALCPSCPLRSLARHRMHVDIYAPVELLSIGDSIILMVGDLKMNMKGRGHYEALAILFVTYKSILRCCLGPSTDAPDLLNSSSTLCCVQETLRCLILLINVLIKLNTS